jgi:hypothetical protein
VDSRSVRRADAVYKAGEGKGPFIMLNRLVRAVVIAALVMAAGCLQKESSHTLYLSPDGSVAWAAAETGVYSDEHDPGKRWSEEQEYLAPVLLGTHGMARAFMALEPAGQVRTTIVRDERPFHVVTDARFERVDRLLERLFTKAGIRTTASFVREGDQGTLHVRLDFRAEKEPDPVVADLLDPEHSRFALTDGRFGAVTGFDVQDGQFASLSRDWLDRAEQAYAAKGTIEFALTIADR